MQRVPDIAPDPANWLALDEQERISEIAQAHDGRFPDALHSESANEILHASLHAIVETQIASQDPPATGQTVARLEGEGLRRHAAVHAVMRLLAKHLAGLDRAPFDRALWTADLAALTAGEALGQALQNARFAPIEDEAPPQGRAARRAAVRAARKRPGAPRTRRKK